MKEEIKSAINKAEYAKWLTSEIDFNERYHNHKETMAWVVTALYVPGAIILGSIVSSGQLGMKVIVTVFLSLVACLVFLFVNMQLRMRWYAADVVHVLMQRMAELNLGVELPRSDEWAIDKEDDVWPHFVQKEIDKLKENRKFKRLCISSCNLIRLRLSKVDDRWKTEFTTYLAIALVTLFAICLVWN